MNLHHSFCNSVYTKVNIFQVERIEVSMQSELLLVYFPFKNKRLLYDKQSCQYFKKVIP